MDFETLSVKVKSFCEKYEKIYIYSRGYVGQFTQDFLKRNKIEIVGFLSKEDEGICGTQPIKSIDSIVTCIDKCGIVVVVDDMEKEEIINRFGELNNFIYIKPNDIYSVLRNGKTSDGKISLCDWNWVGNIETDWWVKFIRHHFSDCEEKFYFYSVFGNNSLVREPRDGIKIFYSQEALGDVDDCFRNPKKSKFNHCLSYVDLSLSFEPLDAMNYMQFPFWLKSLFSPETTLESIKKLINDINNTHYQIADACACICRHDNWKTRTMVYDNIKDLMDVKFAGPWKNNTDELFKKYNNNKVEYLKRFQFNICAENINSEGYCTEKIFDAFRSDAIPLYYGDMNRPYPNVINQKAVIFFEPNSNNEKSRSLIKDLMTNKSSYLDFIHQPKILPSSAEYIYEHYFIGVYKRLEHLINKRKEARRSVRFLGVEPLRPFVYEKLDEMKNFVIKRRDDTQFNFYKYDKLLPNKRYNIRLSDIKADFDEFTMGLYDFKNLNQIKYNIFSTSKDIDFNFETKEDVERIALCIYAGNNGDTKGKEMTIGSMVVIAADI